MSTDLARDDDREFVPEPERYELQESGWRFELGRRDFLRVLGGGLLVLCLGPGSRGARTGQGPTPGRRGPNTRRDRGLACTLAKTAL